MKIKILKSLKATIVLANGDSFTSDFKPSLKRFYFPRDKIYTNHDFDRCLEIRDINEEGIVVAYIFSSDYNPRLFYIKDNTPLEIEDYVRVFNPKGNENEQQIRLIIQAEFVEIEIDDGHLQLLVKESARDTSCVEYVNGEEKDIIDIKEGTTFKTKLMKKASNYTVIVKKIDKTAIALDIENVGEIVIDQYHYYFESHQGGYNSHYDSETFERYYSIELLLPDSIMIRKDK